MNKLRSLATLLLTAPYLSACSINAASAPKVIAVDGAPKAAGPYSQGIVANGFLFAAGQLARDPATGSLVQGDITVQTNRVLDNLEAVLKGAGCSFKDVVHVTVYLANVDDFNGMNAVMATRFGDSKPARSTIQAGKIPGGALVEIDLIARVPN